MMASLPIPPKYSPLGKTVKKAIPQFYFIFFWKILFEREREHKQEEGQREREKEKQTPTEQETQRWGTDPRALRSWPEQKAEA